MKKVMEVKDLCKTYVIEKRQNNVLKNVSFDIEEGEMIGIMGPSGSGKSTLLYSISGMDKATSGEVILDGKKITDLSEKELASVRLNDMGFIFQQMFMMKNLTIMDNILLPAVECEKSSETRKEKVARCEELMRKLGIIARSMVNNPKILFADEPTGALNRQSSAEVISEIEKLNAEGTTVLMVTHDAKVASRCSRVLYISDGNIKSEYRMPEGLSARDRERALNNWLMDLGW